MKNIVKGGLTPKMILDDVSSHLSPLLFHHSCFGGGVGVGDADDFFVDQLLNLNNVVVDETQPLETVIVHQQQQQQPQQQQQQQQHEYLTSKLQQQQRQQQQQVFEDKDASFLSSPLDTAEEADLEWLSHFVDDSSCPYSAPFPPGYSRLDCKPEPKPKPKPKPTRPPLSLKRDRKRNRVWARPSSNVSLGQGKGKGQGQQKRCSHCGVHKTPQWRVGPDGERTLCNACGVRYKSGRLLPEYRPACSPSFSSALHSNNHKKVMEMRMMKYNMNKEEENGLV